MVPDYVVASFSCVKPFVLLALFGFISRIANFAGLQVSVIDPVANAIWHTTALPLQLYGNFGHWSRCPGFTEDADGPRQGRRRHDFVLAPGCSI
jgi:hypothetical protein